MQKRRTIEQTLQNETEAKGHRAIGFQHGQKQNWYTSEYGKVLFINT